MFQEMLQIGTSVGTTGIVPLVPRMTSNNTWGTLLEGQVGGECKNLHEYHVATFQTWKAFDYDDSTWASDCFTIFICSLLVSTSQPVTALNIPNISINASNSLLILSLLKDSISSTHFH